MIKFRLTSALETEIRADLDRRHRFAKERVGFIGAGVVCSRDSVLIVAHSYLPTADNHYERARYAGARVNRRAIRKAITWAVEGNFGLFFTHTHGGMGIPRFSIVDDQNNLEMVPSMFNFCSRRPHGAIVFSDEYAYGEVWLGPKSGPITINEFGVVGWHCRKWRVQ